MNAVYKSKTSTGNASVNKRDDCGIWASASVIISARRRSVRLRTSNFSCCILACVIESGGGFGFLASLEFNLKEGREEIRLAGRLTKVSDYIQA